MLANKNFWSERNFGSKEAWVQSKFCDWKNVRAKKSFGSTTNFWPVNILDPKQLWVLKYLGSEKILGPHKKQKF